MVAEKEKQPELSPEERQKLIEEFAQLTQDFCVLATKSSQEITAAEKIKMEEITKRTDVIANQLQSF